MITAERLGKRYRIHHRTGPRYLTLRDVVTEKLGRIARLAAPREQIDHGKQVEEFWALNDVTFELSAGERLGIIGRNGAGKSTLLKILSRLTDPTTGRAVVRGRVGSLLEVGTGFHPELTGRENVFLNGAILGMKKSEIARRFDEIVAFAEVEQFIDTPVKHFSSGMHARLAFAVAAHLEPDILIVDEVLAVGDLKFQSKCLGRMEEAGRAGRTILFVSHNMATITSLCTRCILLDQGRVASDGPTSEVVLEYYTMNQSGGGIAQDFSQVRPPIGDGVAQLKAGFVRNDQSPGSAEISITDEFQVGMRFHLAADRPLRVVPNLQFMTADGVCAFSTTPPKALELRGGEHTVECLIPAHFLNEGAYFVHLAVNTIVEDRLATHFYERSALSFNIRDPLEESEHRHGWGGPIPGVVRPALDWRVVQA
ncbi:MAG: ABC transporter ATP-binding protein [Burkholderiales bacterium]|nr:ABC transporter ATP-binding protein [Burkholderiales bacterium]